MSLPWLAAELAGVATVCTLAGWQLLTALRWGPRRDALDAERAARGPEYGYWRVLRDAEFLTAVRLSATRSLAEASAMGERLTRDGYLLRDDWSRKVTEPPVLSLVEGGEVA
jgi:hypothetical protein